MQEVREIGDLGDAEPGAGMAALHRVTFGEEGTDGAPVAIVQHHDGADQIGRILFTPGALAVTRYAFGYINALAAISSSRVHDVYIHWSSRRLAGRWRRRQRGQILC